MNKKFLFILLLQFTGTLYSQHTNESNKRWLEDCKECSSYEFYPDSTALRETMPPIYRYDYTFYTQGTNQKKKGAEFDLFHTLQRNWTAHQELGYIAPAFVKSIGKEWIAPVAGEGINPVSMFEAKIPVRLLIAQGRRSSATFWRRTRATLDYIPNFRMLSDPSKPLTPSDQRVGLGLDYTFWDNNIIEKGGAKYDTLTFEPVRRDILWSANISFQAHHYSNGQGPGFHFMGDSTMRNDHVSGDFSTNYLKFGLTTSRNSFVDGSLFQASIFYRWDLGAKKGGLVFSEEQEKEYGKHRLSLRMDFRPKVIRWRSPLSYKQNGKTYLVDRAYQSLWRLEVTGILCDVDNFRPNLEKWNGKDKYRTSVRAYYQFNPLNHRSIGYMIMLYYGRDYLNIRYDNIIVSAQVGFSIALDKYFPTTYHTNETIRGTFPDTCPKDSMPGKYFQVE